MECGQSADLCGNSSFVIVLRIFVWYNISKEVRHMERYCFARQKVPANIQNSGDNYWFQVTAGRKLTDRLHSHDFYETVAVLRGACEHEVNGAVMHMDMGDYAILRPDDRHRFVGQTENTSLVCISVAMEEFERLADCFGVKDSLRGGVPSVRMLPAPLFAETGRLSGEIRIAVRGGEALMRLLLCGILAGYSRSAEMENSGMPVQPLQILMRKMEQPENLREGVPAMLRLSGYSQSQLSRLMKGQCGCTLQQYVMRLRMDRACREITLTDRRFEEIAEEIGYSSFSHFSQSFKAHIGVTPAVLRKTVQSRTV